MSRARVSVQSEIVITWTQRGLSHFEKRLSVKGIVKPFTCWKEINRGLKRLSPMGVAKFPARRDFI